MQKPTVILDKAGGSQVLHAQGKVGTSDALLWFLCTWTLWGGGHKIKTVGNWRDFSSPLPTAGSVETNGARIKGRPRLDLHLCCINAVMMAHFWNTQHLREVIRKAREIVPIMVETQRHLNCKQRQAYEILEERSSDVDGEDDLANI